MRGLVVIQLAARWKDVVAGENRAPTLILGAMEVFIRRYLIQGIITAIIISSSACSEGNP